MSAADDLQTERRAGPTLLGAALVVTPIAAALTLPPEPIPPDAPLWHHATLGAVGLLVALLAAWVWRGRETAEVDRAGGWGIALGIVVLAAALRLPALDRVPLKVHPDAALNAEEALPLFDALPAWTPTAPELGIESLFLYGMGATLRLLGVSLFSLRLYAVALSLLTLVAIFGMARELFGRRVALLAATLVAVCGWPALMARAPNQSHIVALLVATTWWVLPVALRTQQRRWWLLGGLLLGLSFHAYTSYRHGLPLAVLVLLAHPRPVRWRWILAGVAVPLLAAVPAALAGGYWDWTTMLREHSQWTEVTGGRGGSALPNAVKIVPHAFVVRMGDGLGIGMFPGLALCAALPLLARKDLRWFALLGLGLLAPPLVARDDLLAPRRFMALVPIFFPAAALALVELHRRLGRPFGAAVALLVAGQLVLTGRAFGPLGELDDPAHASLRAAARIAAQEGALVLVPTGTAAEDDARFYLLEQGVAWTPDDDPFLLADDDRGLALLPLGTRLGLMLRETQPALRRGVEDGIEIWRLSRSEWRAGLQRDDGPLASHGWLHIPRAGRWRLAIPDGGGTLILDGAERGGGGASLDLVLARGMHRYEIRGGGGQRPILSWRPPDAPRSIDPDAVVAVGAAAPPAPMAPRWWTVVAKPGPWRAGPARVEGRRWLPLRRVGPFGASRGAPPHEGIAVLAGPAPGRAARLLLVGRSGPHAYDIALDAAGASHPAVAPWTPQEAGGGPLPRPRVDEASTARAWAAAAAGEGGALLAITQARRVVRLGPDGRALGDLGRADGWRDPVAVAASHDGRVAVADPGRAEIALFHRSDAAPVAHVLEAGAPVAVGWLPPRKRPGEPPAALVWLDDASGMLVRQALDGDGRPTGERHERFVGPVTRRARLTVSPAGWIAVVLPAAGRVRLYDGTDETLPLLAPGGAPAALDAISPRPVAAAWSTEDRLWLLDARGGLLELALHR